MLKTSQSCGHSGSDPAAADIAGSHAHADQTDHPGPVPPTERTIRENFPVALRILPARHRKGLSAVYRYARLVDDIGDEAPPEERGQLLDLVDRDIDRI